MRIINKRDIFNFFKEVAALSMSNAAKEEVNITGQSKLLVKTYHGELVDIPRKLDSKV